MISNVITPINNNIYSTKANAIAIIENFDSMVYDILDKSTIEFINQDNQNTLEYDLAHVQDQEERFLDNGNTIDNVKFWIRFEKYNDSLENFDLCCDSYYNLSYNIFITINFEYQKKWLDRIVKKIQSDILASNLKLEFNVSEYSDNTVLEKINKYQIILNDTYQELLVSEYMKENISQHNYHTYVLRFKLKFIKL